MVVNGILFRTRTGCPGRGLPGEYGKLRAASPSWWRELDRDRGPGAEQVGLTPDEDLQRIALVNEVAFLVVGEPDPDLPSAEPE